MLSHSFTLLSKKKIFIILRHTRICILNDCKNTYIYILIYLNIESITLKLPHFTSKVLWDASEYMEQICFMYLSSRFPMDNDAFLQ